MKRISWSNSKYYLSTLYSKRNSSCLISTPALCCGIHIQCSSWRPVGDWSWSWLDQVIGGNVSWRPSQDFVQGSSPCRPYQKPSLLIIQLPLSSVLLQAVVFRLNTAWDGLCFTSLMVIKNFLESNQMCFSMASANYSLCLSLQPQKPQFFDLLIPISCFRSCSQPGPGDSKRSKEAR